MPTIVEEADDSGAVAGELTRRLRQFNERAAGPLHSKPVVLSLRDSDGVLIGGLAGELFWNALFVDLLWVDESHRLRSHGSSLLRRAEAIAAGENRGWVYLSTFDFQAPAFYARHGYQLIGELDGVPQRSKRQWFRKAIGQHAV